MKKNILLLIFAFFVSTVVAQDWSWQNPLPQGNNLMASKFVSETIGYIVGDGGTIIKTSNSGDNWVLQNSGTKNLLNSVSFVNEALGFAGGNNGCIVKTENGGNTWRVQYSDSSF
ncbi:MAG: YCF48-related protein, partial [Ignavibacteriaceae bacterium]|nr:YCF48-related protein [Ignavibacteriaceae bacterium]